MNKNKLSKPRKKINAEINKNLGDNPERIAKNIIIDPRPTTRIEGKNRYSMILNARKDAKRIREEKKMKIPHLGNKKNLVKRWKVEAEETNLSLEQIEYEVKSEQIEFVEKGEEENKLAIEEHKLKIENKLEPGKPSI